VFFKKLQKLNQKKGKEKMKALSENQANQELKIASIKTQEQKSSEISRKALLAYNSKMEKLSWDAKIKKFFFE